MKIILELIFFFYCVYVDVGGIFTLVEKFCVNHNVVMHGIPDWNIKKKRISQATS